MSSHTRTEEWWNYWFIDLAEQISTASKDPSTKTGAVIVDSDRRIISTGYNGFPKGDDDDPERYADREQKYRDIIHADMNALLFARRDLTGCTIYTWPFLPCDRCFPHLVQHGIQHFIAPSLPSHLVERWGDAVARVKDRAYAMGVRVLELDPKPEVRTKVIIKDATVVQRAELMICSRCRTGLYYVAPGGVLFCVNASCPEFEFAQGGVRP